VCCGWCSLCLYLYALPALVLLLCLDFGFQQSLRVSSSSFSFCLRVCSSPACCFVTEAALGVLAWNTTTVLVASILCRRPVCCLRARMVRACRAAAGSSFCCGSPFYGGPNRRRWLLFLWSPDYLSWLPDWCVLSTQCAVRRCVFDMPCARLCT
jgi:hypothetical protein